MNRVSTSQGIMAFLLITLTLLLSGCGEKPESMETFLEGKTMGTTYHIKYYDEQGQLSGSQLQLQIDAVLKDVNQSMSTYIEDSEINTFNRLPANQVMPISEDFRAVIS